MTPHFKSVALSTLLLAAGNLSGQVGTINNFSQPGSAFPTYSTTTVGGQTTSGVYDYGGILSPTTSQFPSPQFPSAQFPSASTPSATYSNPYNVYGAYGNTGNYSPFAGSMYNPGQVPVTITQPAQAVATPLTPIGTTTTLTPALSNQTLGATTLQQVYPQPGYPNPSAQQVAQGPTAPPLVLQIPPLQSVIGPERYAPGLATIREGRWVMNDLFYGLPINIGVKVEVITPPNRYFPLNQGFLESRIREALQGGTIIAEPIVYPCSPPLPMFNVIVMAYPCERKCVGVITVQLLEPAKLPRIDVDINGIWQVISWERQIMIASACEEFELQVGQALDRITQDFVRIFKYYHPPRESPCFDVQDRTLY